LLMRKARVLAMPLILQGGPRVRQVAVTEVTIIQQNQTSKVKSLTGTVSETEPKPACQRHLSPDESGCSFMFVS
jgi:hypothetical protein